MRRYLICGFLVLALSGCSIMYRPAMQQGTLLTNEALANLKAGLSKRQVRLLLGTPSVNDPFHPDRWDYVFSVARAGDRPPPPPRLTLFFENDRLVRADGDLAPPALPGSGADTGPADARP